MSDGLHISGVSQWLEYILYSPERSIACNQLVLNTCSKILTENKMCNLDFRFFVNNCRTYFQQTLVNVIHIIYYLLLFCIEIMKNKIPTANLEFTSKHKCTFILFRYNNERATRDGKFWNVHTKIPLIMSKIYICCSPRCIFWKFQGRLDHNHPSRSAPDDWHKNIELRYTLLQIVVICMLQEVILSHSLFNVIDIRIRTKHTIFILLSISNLDNIPKFR